MQDNVMICLECGRQITVAGRTKSKTETKLCPACGSSNLVKYNPADFFKMFVGAGGG